MDIYAQPSATYTFTGVVVQPFSNYPTPGVINGRYHLPYGSDLYGGDVIYDSYSGWAIRAQGNNAVALLPGERRSSCPRHISF